MARNLIEYIVYDLDEQKIMDFRSKPQTRKIIKLHTEVMLQGEVGHRCDPGRIRRLNDTEAFDATINESTQTILAWLYKRLLTRDETIRRRHANGESLSALAREYGLTPARIHQIVNFCRKINRKAN